MKKKVEKMFLVLEIVVFEDVALSYLYYEVNSSDQQSTSYQTVVRSQIWLEEMFFTWIFLRSNVKLG